MPQKTILCLVSVLLFFAQTLAQCPEGCRCYELNQTVRVYCESLNWITLPTNLRTDILYFHLDQNRFTELTSRMFSPFTRLQNLSLYRNRIHTIAPDAFSGLTQLQEIELSYNNISFIHNNTFAGLPSLRSLNLGNNRLATLGENVIDDLPEGIDITLNTNPWNCNCSFLAVWRRFHLVWPNWYITCWDPENLRHRSWHDMTVIDFCPKHCPDECRCYERNNRVEVYCTDGLNSMPANIRRDVNVLVLTRNLITELTSGLFSPFTRLEQLYLQFNHIHTVGPAFIGLRLLQEISFRMNNISVIHNDSFADLPSLRGLNLQDNQLTTLGENVVDDLPAGINITLYLNHWTCDCNFLAMWRRFHLSHPTEQCYLPKNLSYRPWSSLSEEVLCPELANTSTTVATTTEVTSGDNETESNLTASDSTSIGTVITDTDYSEDSSNPTLGPILLVLILVPIFVFFLTFGCLLLKYRNYGAGKSTGHEKENRKKSEKQIESN